MPTLSPRRTGTTALTIAAVLLTALPGHAAPAAPHARPDRVTLTAGARTTVTVLANDTITRGTTVRLTKHTTGLRTRLTRRGQIRLHAPTDLTPGRYRLRYRLTDPRGRTDTAPVRVTVTASPTSPPPASTPTLRDRIAALPVAAEQRTGYDRNLFRHWIDADNNGCDTRKEVLLAEATTAPTVGAGCTLTGGTWTSYYDRATTNDSSTFDIDHLIPLAEAFDSGAHAWTAETRTRFANDLDDPRALVAVTASSNRSKADRDPTDWLPTHDRCRYLTEWVAIKTRWALTVDRPEKDTLTRLAADCPNPQVPVTPARVDRTDTPPPAADPATPAPRAGSVRITQIAFDPEGDDHLYETVTLRNTTQATLDLRGCTLADRHGHVYTFPTTAIGAGVEFTVRATTGADTTTGPTPTFHAGWGAVWNNTGDTATVASPDGQVQHTCTYDSSSHRVATC